MATAVTVTAEAATLPEPDSISVGMLDYLIGLSDNDLMPLRPSPNAQTILVKRYLQPGETPNQMFCRVARKLVLIDLRYQIRDGAVDMDKLLKLYVDYRDAMRTYAFIPAGRTLANPTTSVPNCVVLHPKDSMESIMDVLKEAALLQKVGCGLGFPLHLLRPTGEVTTASGGHASGPVSFLYAYDALFGVIKQQNRHGANMGVMRVDHPDILEFVHCKAKEVRSFLGECRHSLSLWQWRTNFRARSPTSTSRSA